MTQKMIGRWAICSHGRLGRIDGKSKRIGSDTWTGVGLDGKPWQSKEPRLVHLDDTQFLDAIDTEQVKSRMGVVKGGQTRLGGRRADRELGQYDG